MSFFAISHDHILLKNFYPCFPTTYIVNETTIVRVPDLLFKIPEKAGRAFMPQNSVYKAQCFAASHPLTYNLTGDNPGPTGIHCTMADFVTIYDSKDVYEFVVDGVTFYYVVKLQDSLLQKFNKTLAPSRNLTGVAHATCLNPREPAPFTIYGCSFDTDGYGIDNDCKYANGGSWGKRTYPPDGVNGCTCSKSFPDFDKCAPNFEYPWFRELLRSASSTGPYDEPVTPWHNPPDSLTRRMFRLPVVDLSKLTCTPSPFINAGHAQNSAQTRPSRSSTGFFTPCNDIMTQVIISINVCLWLCACGFSFWGYVLPPPHVFPLSLCHY